MRLIVALLLMLIGARAMYGVAGVLPTVQAEFGAAPADASMPPTLLMICGGIRGLLL